MDKLSPEEYKTYLLSQFADIEHKRHLLLVLGILGIFFFLLPGIILLILRAFVMNLVLKDPKEIMIYRQWVVGADIDKYFKETSQKDIN